MGIDVLPVAVRRFLEDHVDTVSSLEVLLLLQRDDARRWSGPAVARELHLDEGQVEGILTRLKRRRLIRRRGTDFQYAPPTDEIARVVQVIADHYPRYRWRIISLVFSPKPAPPGKK